jgi:cis-L-3-hydroxyproline dehydratase
MKISRIDVYARTYSLVGGEYVWAAGLVLKSLDTTIVKITTDEGLSGFGETCPQGAAYLPAFATGARAGAHEIGAALLGHDPCDLRVINSRMDAALLGHPYAKTPFDEACWDILGKASGQSVSTLLGGRYRDEYPTYFAISQDSPEVMAEQATARYVEGFRQIQLKVGGDPDDDIARMRAVREALDPRVSVMGDANTGWSVRAAARFVRGVEDLDVYVEQPCKTYEECQVIRQRTTLPFSLDEIVVDTQTIARGYHDRAMDIVNLKISRLGGLTRIKAARDMCESLGITMTLEDAMGGDITTACVNHLVASTRPDLVFSSINPSSFIPERYAAGAPELRRGVTHVPTGPGLGIEVDESWLGEPLFSLS